MIYDVVIVGAGPAGLFVAYKLKELDKNIRIIVIDKGKKYQERECPILKRKGTCEECVNCELISGEGGAGLFSDGKLVYTLDTGTSVEYSNNEKIRLLSEIKKIFTRFNGNFDYTDVCASTQNKLKSEFIKVGLGIKFYPILHLGSSHLKKMMNRFLVCLRRLNVAFLLNTEAIAIKDVGKNIKKIIIKSNNEHGKPNVILGKNIMFAMGKEGSFKLSSWMNEIGVEVAGNWCYFGFRIELPTIFLKKLFNISPNPKIYMGFPDGTDIKTHCFCNNGEILLLKYQRLPIVGGHSYINGKYLDSKIINGTKSNFAILLGQKMKYPDLVERSLHIAKKAYKITNGYLLAQRMGDFISEPKKSSFKSNYSNVNIGDFAKLGNILEIDIPFDFKLKCIDFIKRMNSIVPGIMHENNLIYAPAIEWWMPKIKTNEEMQTKFDGIYAIGDGAGLSQGIVQSIATALIAARSIYKKNKFYRNSYDKTKSKFLYKEYTSDFTGDLR